MGIGLVVRSQVKNCAKIGEKKLSVSADFYEALDRKVAKLVEEACIRATSNNRNTLMARDV